MQIETKKDMDPSVDRVVTVKGNPEACWRVRSCVCALTNYRQDDYISDCAVLQPYYVYQEWLLSCCRILDLNFLF